ncbi:glycosyltransferase family 4 protein [Chryseobacterium sp. MP_3.2]|uniref:glycosyltransferase family 4 protein n=1 Tax=Chryseobacterium sp. MP_3.2 TaxID=3071712 RepID=UPI002DF7FA8C|nr:glycosyltransferase involved in cell wall biosynthesis [Chryseobacterium sp. MP_3.2]
MKLLYITNGITGSGGLERVLSVKASLLADDFGYEVHVLRLNEAHKEPFFSFSEKLMLQSIAVSGNPLHYFLTYKKGIQKIVDEIKPDIISVCDDGLKGFFLPLIIQTKAKWIHESHASLQLGNSGTGLSLLKKRQHHLKQFLGKRFSKIVLLTEGNKKEWSVKNLVIIPNSLPFASSAVSTLQNKRIIAVGSFSYNKGYDLLLQIWKDVAPDFPEWELNIYGSRTNENLQLAATHLKLKNVHFHDPVRNIAEKYLESSIMVLPSRSEGFGMVLIEAMNCGLPVISFDCPNGPKDIITEGEDGFLIKNGNIESFAEKLRTLMESEELRQKMGAAARLNSLKYHPNEIVTQWDQLFKSLM